MTDETELGRVTWHSSDEDSVPDVGLSLGLGGDRALYIGELAEQTLEDNEIGEHIQGTGWWIAHEGLYGLGIVGAVAKPDEARELFDAISGAFAALLQERETLIAAASADQRQKRAYLDEIDRQKVKLAELRGVLEWIANHRNTHLTDGSAATRVCLDEIVNLAAATLSSSEVQQ